MTKFSHLIGYRQALFEHSVIGQCAAITRAVIGQLGLPLDGFLFSCISMGKKRTELTLFLFAKTFKLDTQAY